MTSTTLKIVSPLDSSTVLFDLNDGTNTMLLADPDFGAPGLETNTADSPALSIGSTTYTRRSLATMRLRIRVKGSSYDDLISRVNSLAQCLADGCVIQYVGYGSSVTRYIDIEPSPTPAIVDGRELALWKVAQLFDSPEGLELNLLRQPYLRGSALTPSVNVLANATMLRDANDDGTPDSWTKTSTPTLTIASSTDSLHLVCGSASQGVYQNSAAASASSGQAWTLSADVKVTSGTAALVLDWRTSGDVTISNTTTTTTSSTWTRISASGTAPATTDHVRVRLESSGAAATFDVRNVQLELASSASDFRVAGETLTLNPAATSGFTDLLPVYNPGNASAPCVISLKSPDAAASTTDAFYALRSTNGVDGFGRVADLLNGPHFAKGHASADGWSVTLGAVARTNTDTSAFSGTRVEVDHTSSPQQLARRIKWSRSTRLDALRGDYDVWVRVKATASTNYRLQLRYGGGTSTPSAYTLDKVDHDTSYASSYQWSYVNLGRISFPTDAATTYAGMVFELWTRIEDSSVGDSPWTLYIDGLVFRPVDSVSQVSMPASATLTTLGKDLDTGTGTSGPLATYNLAGVPTGDYMKFPGDSSGIVWESGYAASPGVGDTGLFRGTFTVRIKNSATKVDTIVEMLNGASQVAAASQRVNRGDTVLKLSVMGTAPTTATYFRFSFYPVTASLGTKDFIVVRTFDQTYIPAVAQNQYLVTDPGSVPGRSIVEKQDTSGNFILSLDATQVPFWIPPGLSLLGIDIGDAAAAGYDEPASSITRTVTVTPTVHPRYWT